MSKMLPIYEPAVRKLLNYKNGEDLPFYCGKCYNDVAATLVKLDLGYISLQDAYINIVNIKVGIDTNVSSSDLYSNDYHAITKE